MLPSLSLSSRARGASFSVGAASPKEIALPDDSLYRLTTKTLEGEPADLCLLDPRAYTGA